MLFPLLFIVFAGTGIHPGVSGTPQEQVRQVAAAEGRWRLVHGALTAASLLGVSGAALLSGVVLMEVGLVAPLATACADDAACVAGEAGVAIADLGWSRVPPLTWAGVPWRSGCWFSVPSAACPLAAELGGGTAGTGGIGLLFTNPGLHGPARYPLVFVLAVFASLAARWAGGDVGAPRSPRSATAPRSAAAGSG